MGEKTVSDGLAGCLGVVQQPFGGRSASEASCMDAGLGRRCPPPLLLQPGAYMCSYDRQAETAAGTDDDPACHWQG
jgi:hypothetical protein